MKKTAICFDLDGTLLDPQDQIHPLDKALLLNPPPGVTFIPCTGRTRGGVREMFERNGMFDRQVLPFPMTVSNGTLCFAPGEQLTEYRALPRWLQEELLRRLTPTRLALLFFNSDQIHLLNPTPYGVETAERYAFYHVPFRDDSRDIAFAKVMVLAPDHERLVQVSESLADLPLERAFNLSDCLALTQAGVTKASGAALLLQRLGLEDAQVLAAGDGENDLPLFALAQRSVAPHTAPEHVRQAASAVVRVSERGLFTPLLE